MLTSIGNLFQYLKQIYNFNVKQTQKYLHEMVMLLICIFKYSKGIERDLALLGVEEFLAEMQKVAEEAFRVLKKGKICAVMIGDVRKHGKVIPLGFRMMECFLQAGFVNKEIIIKEQHNCRSTDYWEKRNNDFLLLAHEYIFVFRK